MKLRPALIGLSTLALLGCGGDEPPARPAAPAAPQAQAPQSIDAADAQAKRLRAAAAIDGQRILNAGAEPENWLAHGRTFDEQRHSPLKNIHTGNVGGLGLAWTFDLGVKRGVEATPIVVDGVMFITGPWSLVWALDAVSGEELWRFDPKVPRAWAQKGCCDVVNRGVAVHEGKVYLGTFDGRLVALDAGTGEVVWETNTIDRERPYTSTGAPRIVKGKVLIGNGGAEYGVRGYFSAYDAETGELAWRFYTVPGDPAKPAEHEELNLAARTWDPESKYWEIGGGGTVWDSMAYDPELDLLYVGVGNGSPWSRERRSSGDNLFLSSILAVRPDTGKLVWHYQTTPGDNWDYTATQHMILADIELYGETRKVLMQAPKNAFFYVLDRVTGELLSADKFVPANWASHVDLSTGRPVETGAGDYSEGIKYIYPGPIGAHSWHPMAYSPDTGYVYIPAMETLASYEPDPQFLYRPGWWNPGTGVTALRDIPPETTAGRLIAWDPVRRKAAWKHELWGPWNGGVLSTAGGLVFQGGGDGTFRAHNAATGEVLWTAPAHTGIVAAPVTYAVEGVQYVTVLAGWGGVFALAAGRAAKAAGVESHGRVLTWRIGGDAEMPPPPKPREQKVHMPMPEGVDPEHVEFGRMLYHGFCAPCHGYGAVGGGVISDLRYARPETHAAWQAIVLEGAYAGRGMAGFKQWIGPQEAELIRLYVLKRGAEGDVPQ